MLRSELIRPRLEIYGGQVRPKLLPADYHYLTIAGDLIRLFRQHIGCSRGELAQALREYEGDGFDYPVIRGPAAVLEARCTFGSDPPVEPATLRAALFRLGPVTRRPGLLHLTTREQALVEVAAQFGLTAEQVEAALFADLPEEQILLDLGEPARVPEQGHHIARRRGVGLAHRRRPRPAAQRQELSARPPSPRLGGHG